MNNSHENRFEEGNHLVDCSTDQQSWSFDYMNPYPRLSKKRERRRNVFEDGKSHNERG